MAKNALVKAPSSLLPAIVTEFGKQGKDDVFSVSDNMEGVTPKIPKLEMSKDGVFLFPDGEIVKSFKGVILHHHGARAWWENSEVTGSAPDCFSNDGSLAEPGKDKCPLSPQLRAANLEKYKTELVCGTCPMNEWGSRSDGKPGKACKEMHIMFVLAVEKDLASAVPYRLSLPPSSLKDKDAYFTMLTGKDIPFPTVITQFGLNKVTNSDGQPYAEIVLKSDTKVRLARDDQLVLKGLIKQYKNAFSQKLDEAEYAVQEEQPAAPEEGADKIAF